MKKGTCCDLPQTVAHRFPVHGLELGCSTSIPRCEDHDLEGHTTHEEKSGRIEYEQTFKVGKRGNRP